MTVPAANSAPGGGNSADPPDIDRLIRQNLSKLTCVKCNCRPIRTDGTSNGRLRIRCDTCSKTSSASQYTEQLMAMKLIPRPSMEESRKSTEVRRDATQFFEKTKSSSKDAMDMEESDNELSDAPTEETFEYNDDEEPDYLTEALTQIWKDKSDNEEKFEYIDTNMKKIEKSLNEIMRAITLLTQKQNALQNAQQSLLSARATISDATYDFDKQAGNNDPNQAATYRDATHQINPSAPPMTYASAVMNNAEVPFTLVQKHRGRYSRPQGETSDATRRNNQRIAEQNHFNSLREAIPSMDRSIATRQAAIEKQTNNNKKIRALSEDEMQRVISGKPKKKSSPLCTLYFRGMRRNRISDIKCVLLTIGIKIGTVRNISFIGKSIMELITYEDNKDDIVTKLALRNISQDKYFDPLSIDNIKSPKHINESMTQEEKQAIANRFYLNRLKAQIDRLPADRRQDRLRNFMTSHTDPENQQRAATRRTTLLSELVEASMATHSDATEETSKDDTQADETAAVMEIDENSENSSNDNNKRKISDINEIENHQDSSSQSSNHDDQ